MTNASAADLLGNLKRGFAQRDRPTINRAVADLLASDVPIGASWRSLADVMVRNGELALARAAMDRFVQSANGDAASRYMQATMLARIGDVEVASAILDGLPDAVPDPVSNAYTRGMIALNSGAPDAARGHFLRGLSVNPRAGQIWYALAMAGPKGRSDVVARRILDARPSMAAASASDRAHHSYACGKVLDDMGDIAGAFAAFADGARLFGAQTPYDRNADARAAAVAISGYDAASIGRHAQHARQPSDRTIFVTGSPRSGTTLVEQILASHSHVVGGEELNKFSLISDEIGGVGAADLDRWCARGNDTPTLAALYAHLVEERFGNNGRVVDKSLDASRYLGLLASILPDAPIVWLRRDPLDRAWSSFRNIMLGVPWSYDLAHIAHHFRLEDALLVQWQRVLGDRLLVIDYEDLVVDPAVQIARLLDHVGLSAEPQVFAPHETQRAVTTASVMQVREPINRKGVGAADPYRAFLKPFTDLYYAT